MKKLKFGSFLKKRLIAWLFITLFTGSALIAGFYFTAYVIITPSFACNSSECISSLTANDDPVAAEMNFKLYFDTEIYREIGVDAAAVVYDNETGEIVFDSEFNSYSVISASLSETGEPIYLRNKSEEFLDKVANWNKEHGGPVMFDIKNIYIDGENFYPGIVVFSELDSDTKENVIGEPETVDYAPENAEDYEETVTTLGLACGTARESAALKDLRAKTQRDGTIFDSYFLRDININGREYRIESLYYFDFWENYTNVVIGMAAALIIIAVICSFNEAHSRYKKYCTQYEIDEYRRNMTNALAHDLKSPLTAIYGYAENLRDNVHSEKKDYYAEAVLENVRYMNEIITNTLDLAKLETDNKGIKAEKVNISDLAAELYKKYLPQAEERGISFKLSGSCTVSADKALMNRAVENLISNAVKFTPDGGEIEITAASEAFVITNSSEKELNTDELNKPFKKGDESRGNRKGSGIGLSMVKNIAALHKFGFETKSENGSFTARLIFKKSK